MPFGSGAQPLELNINRRRKMAKDKKREKAREKQAESIEPLALAEKAREVLESKKGHDIVILDVRGTSTLTDFFVIASGSNPPHIKAMFNEVEHMFKKDGLMCHRKVGNHDSGWMVLDYIDVVIHIMIDETREYYAIEELWEAANLEARGQQLR